MYYRHSEAYAEFHRDGDPNFCRKHPDALRPERTGGRVLDVGCGVGKVVRRLTQAGVEACGVDASIPNFERAREFSERCQLYDGRRRPFPDGHFAAVGALKVLEHALNPRPSSPSSWA